MPSKFEGKGLRQLTCASTVDHSTLKLFTKLTSLPPRRIIPICKGFSVQKQQDLQPAQNTEIKTCIKPTNLGTQKRAGQRENIVSLVGGYITLRLVNDRRWVPEAAR